MWQSAKVVATVAAIALSVAAGLVPAVAGPAVSETVANYQVAGTTTSDLRAAMNAAGPLDQNEGRRYDAHTRADIHWTFTFAQTAGGCRIGDVKTSVNATYTVPSWLAGPKADGAARTKWASYRAALMEHERGHTRLAVATAQRIETAIRAAAPRATCAELTAAANSIASNIIRNDRSQQDYDRATRHGAVQGAVLR